MAMLTVDCARCGAKTMTHDLVGHSSHWFDGETLHEFFVCCRKCEMSSIWQGTLKYPHIGIQITMESENVINDEVNRPSVSLDKDDHQSRQIAKLKQYFPDEISVVVESASDSFSGVKRWAAAFTCSLDGLSVTSANQESGSMHFF